MWIELRSPSGRLMGRWDPDRSLLEIARGEERIMFDLADPEQALLAARAGIHVAGPQETKVEFWG